MIVHRFAGGLEARIFSANVAVAGLMVPAHSTSRLGVHSRWARCDGGMWDGAVM
ncbi:MAG: hypothetical protein M3N98_01755 [Actinomycetota bacterium]|nr:hypothetical protein [Actinomycetota bacterium]